MSAAERDQDRNLVLGYGNTSPEIVRGCCDVCDPDGKHPPVEVRFGYACPAWCHGACGTNGCVRVLMTCTDRDACAARRNTRPQPEPVQQLTACSPAPRPAWSEEAPPWARDGGGDRD